MKEEEADEELTRMHNQEPSPPGSEEEEQKLNQWGLIFTVAWRQEAEYFLGFFDTPSGSEEVEQLLDDLALEMGIENELKLSQP